MKTILCSSILVSLVFLSCGKTKARQSAVLSEDAKTASGKSGDSKSKTDSNSDTTTAASLAVSNSLVDFGTILGKVTLSDHSSPSGITVGIPDTNYQTQTNASGNFVLSNLPPAPSENLSFYKKGFIQSIYTNITLTQSQNTTIDPVELLFDTGKKDSFFITNAISGISGSNRVMLTLNPSLNDVEYILSELSNFSDATWKSIEPNIAYNFSSDGDKTLNIKFRDANKIESKVFIGKITIDTSKPSGYLEIQNGAPAIGSNHATLTISSTGTSPITGIKIDTDSDMSSPQWLPFSKSLPWTFTDGDGEKTLYAVFINEWGAESAVTSSTVVVDTSDPMSPGISVVASTGAQPTFVNSNQVTLNLSGTPSQPNVTIAQALLSESATFVGAKFQSFSPTMPFQLSTGDGKKVIYAQFKDSVGNLSKVVNTVLYLDTVPPTTPALNNQSRRVTTNTEPISFSLGSKDQNFFSFQILGGQYTDWTNVKNPIVINLAKNNAWYTIQVRAIDAAGNTSSVLSYSIFYGAQTPFDLNSSDFLNKFVTKNTLELPISFSPYLVSKDTVMDSTIASNFTIDAGVTLQFADSVNFTVNYAASNKFLINGTKTQHVSFTSASSNPQPGSWGIFSIHSPAGISYLDAQYDTYLELANLAAAGITIKDSTFTNFSTYGLYLVDGSGTFSLSYSTIDCNNNGVGINALNTQITPTLTGNINNTTIQNCPISGINWTQVKLSQSNFINNSVHFISFTTSNSAQNLNNNFWGFSQAGATFQDLKNFTPGVDPTVNNTTPVSSYFTYSLSPIPNAGPR